MNEHEKPQIDFMHKLARQIVERRNLVFLFVILAAIFTVFSVRWVKVETDMTTYLPKTSETRMGLDIMDEQFTTYGSADIMVANITPAEADELSDRLTELKGVQMLDYDDTTDHYNKDAVSALYSITFDYPEDDDQCLEALDRDAFIYGGALTLDVECYVTDRIALLANLRERCLWGGDTRKFHTQFGVGVKFIIN